MKPEILMDLIRKISGWGIGTILIEHDMKVVMNICHRLVALRISEPRSPKGLPRRSARIRRLFKPTLAGEAMLKISRLSIHYANIQVLKRISLEIEAGEIVAFIGANGAGKTTTLKGISGLKGISSGTIVFLGQKINGLSPEAIVGKGIAHCPEGLDFF